MMIRSLPFRKKICHNWQLFINKQFGQSQIVAIGHAYFLAFPGHPRIAKFQSGSADMAHVRDVNDVKLNFSVEPENCRVKEVLASRGEVIKLCEYIGV